MTQSARNTSTPSTLAPQTPVAVDPLQALADEPIEAALLGWLITGDGMASYQQVQHFTEAHFYAPKHKRLWKTIKQVVAAGLTITLDTVKSELGQVSSEGEAYLYELIRQGSSDTANHKKILEHMKWRRDTHARLTSALKVNANHTKKHSEVEEAMHSVFTDLITESGTLRNTRGLVLSEQAAAFGMGEMQDNTGVYISTGYPDLDRAIKGVKPGYLYFIGGDPGSGKSTVGQNLTLNLMHAGLNGGLISIEMPEQEYFYRALAIESGVPKYHIETMTMSDDEMQRFTKVLRKLSGDGPHAYAAASKFHTIYLKMPTLAQIRAQVIEWVHTIQLDFLLFDYINDALITPDKALRGQSLEIMKALVGTLRDLTTEHKLITFVPSQLSRAASKNSAPDLHDFAGSSMVENSADVAVILREDTPYSQALGYGETHMHIVKSRSGGKGQIVKFESRLAELRFLPWRGL